MPFSKVRFYNFRNLVDEEVSLQGREIFLIGENGQGKTNFLEGLYLLCYGSSFRTRQEKLLIQDKKEEFSAAAQYFREGLTHKVQLKVQKNKKQIRIDDKSVTDRKELIWNLPCIIFSHEDIFFVSGTPENRRQFFDQTLSLFDPNYIDVLRGYKKILKNRNKILKEGRKDLMEVLNIQLASKGLELMDYRARVTEKFNQVFTPLFTKVSGIEKPLTIQYRSSWKKRDTATLLAELAGKFDQERILGMTTTGPHRDNYKFLMEGQDFAQTASTGQTRLISLILKVAQGEFFSRETGLKPILLLDDVLLELDGKKRARFLEVLPGYEQAVFTFLPDQGNLNYRKESTLVYLVEKGRLKPYEG